jgi:hypothetical protein
MGELLGVGWVKSGGANSKQVGPWAAGSTRPGLGGRWRPVADEPPEFLFRH